MSMRLVSHRWRHDAHPAVRWPADASRAAQGPVSFSCRVEPESAPDPTSTRGRNPIHKPEPWPMRLATISPLLVIQFLIFTLVRAVAVAEPPVLRPTGIIERSQAPFATEQQVGPKQPAVSAQLEGLSFDGLFFLGARIGEVADGWETVLFDDFEGDWPGPWDVQDFDSGSGRDLWAPVGCKLGGALSGIKTVWCAGEGDQALCGPQYDDNMRAWMIFGPFTLGNAVEAEVEFNFVNQSESTFDSVAFLLSTDGVQFTGLGQSGTTPGYPETWHNEVLDLRAASGLGDITGQPHVWFAALFESDFTQAGFGGAYVDDLTIRRNVVGECTTSQVSPIADSEVCFPASFSLSPAGNCTGMRIAFTTDPDSPLTFPGSPMPLVFTVFLEGNGREIDELLWRRIAREIGGSSVYYWTVGDQIDEFFYPTAPWRPFTVCLPCPSEGDCCSVQAGGGCNDASCCQAVCAIDPDCCLDRWNSPCTSLADEICACDRCGNGECEFDEDCASCPEDCVFTGSLADCNANGTPDGCDIQRGSSFDCNEDGLPDDCDGTTCPLVDREAFTITTDKLWSVDLADGSEALIGPAGNSRFLTGLSFDPTTGELVAVEEDAIRALDPRDGSVLSSVNHGVFLLGTPTGIAIDPDGNLFLIHDGTTYSIDKSTGAATVVGSNSLGKDNALAFSTDGTLYAVGELDELRGLPGLVPK